MFVIRRKFCDNSYFMCPIPLFMSSLKNCLCGWSDKIFSLWRSRRISFNQILPSSYYNDRSCCKVNGPVPTKQGVTCYKQTRLHILHIVPSKHHNNRLGKLWCKHFYKLNYVLQHISTGVLHFWHGYFYALFMMWCGITLLVTLGVVRLDATRVELDFVTIKQSEII